VILKHPALCEECVCSDGPVISALNRLERGQVGANYTQHLSNMFNRHDNCNGKTRVNCGIVTGKMPSPAELRPDKYDECPGCGAIKSRISALCRSCRTAHTRSKLTDAERLERRRLAVKKWRISHAGELQQYTKEYATRPTSRIRARARDRARYDKERGRDSRFKYHLNKYGITVEDYDRAFDKQLGCCAICARAFGARRPWDTEPARAPCADHCHTTGRFRALLCKRCNSAMGIVDNLNLLPLCLEYRDRHRLEGVSCTQAPGQ
jgi:hypothetical protein